MLASLAGRVSNINLPYYKGLMPIYEAIINSFDSIDELNSKNGAYIKIILERDLSQLELDPSDRTMPSILNVVVEDNGVGFNDKNFLSFRTADSRSKIRKGGKGIGRFLWLKAFKNVEISSVFEDLGTYYKREFSFSAEDESGLENSPKLADEKQRKTVIRLIGYDENYAKFCPKRPDVLAYRIIEHCIIYLLQPDCPKLILEDFGEQIELNAFFAKNYFTDSHADEFDIKGEKFSLNIFKLFSSDEHSHKIHYCANRREVISEDLSSHLPNLDSKIPDENGKSFVYVSYIQSAYLDVNSNPERTKFNINDHLPMDFPNTITLEDIRRPALEIVSKKLGPILEPIQEKKEERIKKYIFEKSPQYRHIYSKYRARFLAISPNLSDDNLEIELYKIHHQIELDVKKKGQEVYRDKDDEIHNRADYLEKYSKYIEDLNEIGKANLAQYIVHRKSILHLFEKSLRRRNDDKYPLESAIHELIMPLKSDTDELKYNEHNLWIVDEKLSYHYYLASDKKFSEIKVSGVDSNSRPDLFILNNPTIFSDQETPYQSIVIVEFKRPMRKDYSDDENPIDQVFDYVYEIRNGNKLDKFGRPILNHATIPIFAYIVLDVNKKVEFYLDKHQFNKTPDGLGYYHFHPTYKLYTEVITFDKLIEDSKKRNKILFDHLNLPL